jgi:hypothetical protein
MMEAGMDANINELPDRKAPADNVAFDNAAFSEKALIPERPTTGTWLKAGGFLAVVAVLTALAINSHQQAPGEAAIPDAPPAAAAGSATMPAVTAPTDRATTGAAPSVPPQVPAPRQ